MNNYRVTITEKFNKTVDIEATTAEQAVEIVSAAWKKAEYLCDKNSVMSFSFMASEDSK